MSFIDKIRAAVADSGENERYEYYSQPIQPAPEQERSLTKASTSKPSQAYQGQEPNDMFDVIRDYFHPKIIKERLLLGGFAAIAAACTFVPVLNPQQPTISKTILLLFGLSNGVCLSAGLYFRKPEEVRYQAVENARTALTKQSLKYELAYEGTTEEINALKRIVAFIKQQPEEQQSYWINKYGVQDLFRTPVQEQVAVVETVATPQKQFLPPNQSSISDFVSYSGEPVDYSWLDEQAILKSKAVVGEMGTGKSVLLSYMASLFLSICPEGELKIIDPHFDEDEGAKWLPGIPVDHLIKHYVTRTEGLSFFRSAGKLLRDRVTNGIKLKKTVNGVQVDNPECKPFHLICDEFDAFLPKLNQSEQDEVLQILQETQYEGRKFGVDITLGLHTVKKSVMGVDSSVLFPMNLFILGSILADRNNIFPMDWDRVALLKSQEATQSSLKPGQGVACTFRRLNKPPKTVVIPHVDLSIPIFSIEPEEEIQPPQSVKVEVQDTQPVNQTPSQENDLLWLDEMKAWLKLLGVSPTPAQVKQKYQTITGNQIRDDQLKVLMNYLEITPGAE